MNEDESKKDTMPSLTEKVFHSEPMAVGVAYRYGMLVFCIGLLLWYFVWLAHLRPGYPYERYNGFVVPLMLLLNHLAFAFRWQRRTTLLLRIAAYLWVIVGCFYVFYISHIWFPLPAR